MEELLTKFSHAVATTENDRSKCYKSRGETNSDQSMRRLMMLDAQKIKRYTNVDISRGILDQVHELEATLEEKSSKLYKPKVNVPGFIKKEKYFTNTLMLSEWMVEPPENLSEKWLILACPKGVRTLVVAHKGITKAFSKKGHSFKAWNSHLPGGRKINGDFMKTTVLDCIWNDTTQSFYVLDILAWGVQTFTECDVDFRDFWLRTKFEEMPELRLVCGTNQYAINLIQKYTCSQESLCGFMSTWPVYPDNTPSVDGLLFYHREGHYVGGTTPLVVWLYPYMVNEVLGSDITVNYEYMKEKPADYANQDTFIKKFEEKHSKSQFHQVYQRRRVRSFSSIASNSSLDSANVSNQSFGSGTVQMIFTADSKKTAKSMSTEDLVNLQKKHKKTNKRKKFPKKNKMDIQQNVSIEVDSAVSSMEDSILDDSTAIECELSVNQSI